MHLTRDFEPTEPKSQNPNTIMQGLLMSSEEVVNAQRRWADGIIEIGKVYTSGGDYRSLAEIFVSENYGYEDGVVLFKPTMASVHQFRVTAEEAVSYFVGGYYPEDNGFAIVPWKKIEFANAAVHVEATLGVAMGNYFMDRFDDVQLKVEYTFVFRKFAEGRIRIVTHHSSFPYKRDL